MSLTLVARKHGISRASVCRIANQSILTPANSDFREGQTAWR
jgi:hypothetical protein